METKNQTDNENQQNNEVLIDEELNLILKTHKELLQKIVKSTIKLPQGTRRYVIMSFYDMLESKKPEARSVALKVLGALQEEIERGRGKIQYFLSKLWPGKWRKGQQIFESEY